MEYVSGVADRTPAAQNITSRFTRSRTLSAGSATWEYLADGVTEDVITEIVALPRTSGHHRSALQSRVDAWASMPPGSEGSNDHSTRAAISANTASGGGSSSMAARALATLVAKASSPSTLRIASTIAPSGASGATATPSPRVSIF